MQIASQQPSKYFVLWVAALVSVGGILYGYDMGVIAGALLFMQQTFTLTPQQMGYIVGAVLGGGLLGTLSAGAIADHYGRRRLLIIASFFFMIGLIFILWANTFLWLVMARLLLGVGVGMVAVGVPLYVTEMVPAKHRGKYLTFFQLLLTFGILLAYFVDFLLTDSGNWRGMFSVLFVPTSILLLGMFFLPETPRWLLANDQQECAIKVLHQIYRSDAEAMLQLKSIQDSSHQQVISWREFFSSGALKPSLVALFVAMFNQLTGINSFLQYAPLILKSAGVGSNLYSMLGSLSIGLLNFVFTVLAIFLIDSLGRRPLLILGVLGVVISEVFLASVSYFFAASSWLGVLSLVGLLFFIVSFAIGPGVVVWLAISELFPTRLRGKGIALCLFFNLLVATLLSMFFLPLIQVVGIVGAYSFFAVCSFCYLMLVVFYLPETKAKSLEEIQERFSAASTV